MKPIITSLIDDDLYKATQQMAVCQLYPRVYARYEFINRGNTEFPSGFAAALREQVEHLQTLTLIKDEKDFLRERCYFMTPVYLDFLSGYRHDPEEVHISQSDGELAVKIEGPWYRAILWEVKLMALISELYFQLSPKPEMLRDHIDSPGEVKERAIQKARNLFDNGCVFSDFGTRRRFSYRTQDQVLEGLKQFPSKLGSPGLAGTSNVHLAMKHNLTPIGTQSHEWYMFHAAKYGFRMATSMALGRWVDVFGGELGIALTDTFTTPEFFKHFDSFHARLYNGTRHDSSDPIDYGERAIRHYEELRIEPKSKSIVFSDGLDTDEAISIQRHFDNNIKSPFGIGTHFTADTGCKPLNIVIKMTACKPNDSSDEWVPTIKLSDVQGKHTGCKETIALAKKILGIN